MDKRDKIERGQYLWGAFQISTAGQLSGVTSGNELSQLPALSPRSCERKMALTAAHWIHLYNKRKRRRKAVQE
jgi:hypothetical protein